MFRFTLIAATVLMPAPSLAHADDLYQVSVASHEEARLLASLPTDPVIRLNDGYLVLVDPAESEALTLSGLRWQLVAPNLSRDQLLMDARRDRHNAERFDPIFEQQGIRLYRRATIEAISLTEPTRLFPLQTFRPAVAFPEPGPPVRFQTLNLDDLQTLIARVETDSLESYVLQLQALDGRVAGTGSNIAGRDWIYGKFADFGYDSLFLDPFPQSINGSSTMYNVVATKLGTTYPDIHVVVGAHHDGVPGSPAADDNGSGTAGVLELARILRDVQTDVTIVFATFDAEEYGLYGSWFYAERAAAEGENIIYMLNMDMIAHHENVNQAELMYGPDRSYAELWQSLADSLLGLEAVFGGASGGSDHYPFTQHGIPVTFAAEYIFSNVYHSYRDSTTYMNFDYMTKLVKASLATAYVASMPQPALAIGYPTGLPEWLDPNEATTFQVHVTGNWGGVPVAESGLLHYSVDGGAFETAPLVDLGANDFQATIPAVGCAERVEYYVSVDEVGGGHFVDPDPATPHWAATMLEAVPVFVDDFEADAGWLVAGVVAEGDWERGVPAGSGGSRGDPPADYDGSGSCFVTGNGYNVDLDGGTTILFSPLIDFTMGKGLISYARWYSNDRGADPNNDIMEVFITNGGPWELVETVGPAEQASGGWLVHRFLVQDFVTPNATVQLRFEASDLAGGSVVEAAIDAFQATTYRCQPPLAITTPTLPDGELNQLYSQQLEAINVVGTPIWSDKYNDLAGTGLSLTPGGLLAGWPSGSGAVSITCEVNDDIGLPDETAYSFEITTCCNGRVGDANNLGGDEPTIGDVSTIIDMLFISGVPDGINCTFEADINQSGGTTAVGDDVTIGDVSTLIDYLFITGPSLGLPACL